MKQMISDLQSIRERRMPWSLDIITVMNQREVLVGQIESTLRTTLVSLPGGSMSVADIDRQLGELDKEFQELDNFPKMSYHSFMNTFIKEGDYNAKNHCPASG